MRTTKILIDNREYEMPRAFRAAHILAVAQLDGTYRIFADRAGLVAGQLHPDDWVVPSWGDRFICVPRAIGPGGGDDLRVKAIAAALDDEQGDDDAWDRFDEWERLSD